jgi:hypothetical protein
MEEMKEVEVEQDTFVLNPEDAFTFEDYFKLLKMKKFSNLAKIMTLSKHQTT